MSGMAKHSDYSSSESKANKIEEPAMVYLSGISTANPLEAIGKIRGGLQKNVLDKFIAVSGFSTRFGTPNGTRFWTGLQRLLWDINESAFSIFTPT